MHDVLFKHQRDLIDHDISHFGLMIGLEFYRFEADLNSERFTLHVREDHESGVQSGVKGTPTFFINNMRIVGRLRLIRFRRRWKRQRQKMRNNHR